jgi:cytochrome c oxidase cbb3-type subunit 4
MPQFGLNTLRALVLFAWLIGFLAICAWAWSKKRKAIFHDASLLPLEDDEVEKSAVPGARE